MPKIILNGINVKHNATFFTDKISNNKNNYIKNNIPLITEINTNGILSTNIKPLELGKVSSKYHQYKKDTLRFIAHAGGIIDKFKYTNSKEALDLSYQKGFRLFELDIIKTKDDKYVAAHDWELWSKMTNYKGELPPTLHQFLQYKIHSKFTPLDMNGINSWFTNHKDAVLITDKINKPKLFSKLLKNKDRLIMELFDIKAIKEAINNNIKPMASQNVIENFNLSDIEYFKKIGVDYIGVSRNFIKENIELLTHFKKSNIKIYAFHLNFDPGFNEDHVLKYEMDYIYGIYADEWSFNN